MPHPVFVELTPNGKRIDVDFKFTGKGDANTAAIRIIPGRSFVKKPHRHWTVPLDMTVCRLLRKAYGDRLNMGPDLRAWAQAAKTAEGNLGRMALSDTGACPNLKAVLPSLWRALYLGPLYRNATAQLGYSDKEINRWVELVAMMSGTEAWGHEYGSYQTADVRFLADALSPLNGNQQGLGKTPEHVGAVWEAGLQEGNHLVVAPSAAVDGTWEPELEMWHNGTPLDVEIFACTGNRAQREATLAAFAASDAPVKWVVVNPAMVQYRKQDDPFAEPSEIARKARPKDADRACHCNRLKDPHWHYVATYPVLMDTRWNTICVDECHKGNIRNHRSLTSFSMNDLLLAAHGKRFALSGTPMKKMGADIWGVLHWLRPDVFTSYWRFAEMFFHITDNGFGKKVGSLREDMELEFFQYLTPYVLRRLKSEAAPWLPEKQFIPVPVRLEGKQAKQYATMEAEGMSEVGGVSIETTSILAEFTRLTQFANAYCTIDASGKVVPTRDSAKLIALWQKLDEAGVLVGGDEQVLIFSQSREMVDLVATMLREEGVRTEVISGNTNKQGQRRAIKEAFQGGALRVLCIVTTAGGVSLTLDAADAAHFIDTSWAPDDDEQAEDRLHRVSRIHQVRIYQYFAEGTIDEDRMNVAMEKDAAHKYILDVRRQMLKRKEVA